MFVDIQEYILRSKEQRQLHLKLDEGCIEIGGNSGQARLLLAHYLKTTVPNGMKIHLCHACNNAGCSNPNHLYWGTAKENQDDAGFQQMGAAASKKRGPWNKGMKLGPESAEIRKNKSIAAKRRWNRNGQLTGQGSDSP